MDTFEYKYQKLINLLSDCRDIQRVITESYTSKEFNLEPITVDRLIVMAAEKEKEIRQLIESLAEEVTK